MANKKLAQLKKHIKPFENPDTKASVWQLVNTLPPFFLLWYLAYEAISVSLILSIALSILAGGFVVRVFIIFHDCCHGSFFKNRKVNHFVGTVTGILTMFPYEKWKREHSIHHATSSNLDKRGTGDVWIMSVEEYKKASKLERLQYRLYRNPFIMFVLGPLYLFLITNRMNRKRCTEKRTSKYVFDECFNHRNNSIINLGNWLVELFDRAITDYVRCWITWHLVVLCTAPI